MLFSVRDFTVNAASGELTATFATSNGVAMRWPEVVEFPRWHIHHGTARPSLSRMLTKGEPDHEGIF